MTFDPTWILYKWDLWLGAQHFDLMGPKDMQMFWKASLII